MEPTERGLWRWHTGKNSYLYVYLSKSNFPILRNYNESINKYIKSYIAFFNQTVFAKPVYMYSCVSQKYKVCVYVCSSVLAHAPVYRHRGQQRRNFGWRESARSGYQMLHFFFLEIIFVAKTECVCVITTVQ